MTSCVTNWFIYSALITLFVKSEAPFKGGVWQHAGDTFIESNWTNGWMFTFDWNTTEIRDNVWNWTTIDDQLNAALKIRPDLAIILVPYTGIKAPRWLYTEKNVPEVWLQNGHGPYPWYFDTTYNMYYTRWAMNIYQHITSSNYADNVIAVQQAYGDSGNTFPYHQNVPPANASYNITPEQWWIYEQNMSLYLYNNYYTKKQDIKLLFNMDPDELQEIFKEIPCQMMKSGDGGYGYQRNGEANDFYYGKSPLVRTYDTINNCWIHGRCEIGTATQQGHFVEAPYWNWLSLMEWSLLYGLDIENISPDAITNSSFDKAWFLKNTFGGKKNASISPGGWIHLRDGLDSNNTVRFPESQFGEANSSNSERMIKIAEYMSVYGAMQEDPEAACGKPGNQGKAKKMNDVGFGVYEGNYGNFIQEVGNTSQGYWRVGSMVDLNDIYGRFAKGFKSGYDAICFRLDKGLWGGLPLSGGNGYRFDLDIAYFDNGTSSWSFGYDDVKNGKCVGNENGYVVKMTNTNKWIVKSIVVDGNDAYFGQRCENNSDFCVFNKDGDGNNVKFGQIMILRNN